MFSSLLYPDRLPSFSVNWSDTPTALLLILAHFVRCSSRKQAIPFYLKEELTTEKRVRNRKYKKYRPLVYPPPQQPPPLEVEAVVPLDPVIGYMILVYPVRLLLALSLA